MARAPALQAGGPGFESPQVHQEIKSIQADVFCFLSYNITNNIYPVLVMDIPVNYLAILAAVVSNMVIGSIWYSPKVFGDYWSKIANVNMKNTPVISWVLMIITGFLMAYILSHFIYLTAQGFGIEITVQSAISTAFWAWLGFFVPITMGAVTWEQKPWTYWFVNAGYWLVSLIAMAAILGYWR